MVGVDKEHGVYFGHKRRGFLGCRNRATVVNDCFRIHLSFLCAPSPLRSVLSRPCWGTLHSILEGENSIPPASKTSFSVGIKELDGDSTISIPDLLTEHKELLPKYMSLCSNPWGLRSLLCSTFFNPDIECNLASAWMNPAFATINSILPRKS